MKSEIRSNQAGFLLTSLTILVLCLVSCTSPTLEAQVEPTHTPIAAAEIANPASKYCLEQGGQLSIVESGDGGQYSICLLEDNRQCEEWAFFRGECPAGGPEVTGDVFQNFYSITQVPRKSGSMEKIRQFLLDFGKSHGLETIVDKAGNVIIRKPAAAGFEDSPGVVLQAHMDMVAEQIQGKVFNFETDPIQAFESGDYIVADGTTLGADDGIGIAMIMTILQSQSIQLGPVEGLFTVDEETSMSGANGLEPFLLQGRILINLDAETEGSFYIGSAGGEHVNFNADYPQVSVSAGTVPYLVSVQGLTGGHSGVDIDKGRGHATKLLVRFLNEAAGISDISLASLDGGSVVNALPREASAVIFLDETQVESFLTLLKEYQSNIQSELAATEPDLSVTAEPIQPPELVMDPAFQNRLLNALHGTPQGIIRMSDAVPGLVETSINLGIVQVREGQMKVVYFPRSSVESELNDASQMIASIWELAGYQAEITDSFTAWTPDPGSPILITMRNSYQDLYGKEPVILAIHAGLECGAISGIYPDMDMISIGPTLENVHSPAERLYIPSVGKVMDLLITALVRLAEG